MVELLLTIYDLLAERFARALVGVLARERLDFVAGWVWELDVRRLLATRVAVFTPDLALLDLETLADLRRVVPELRREDLRSRRECRFRRAVQIHWGNSEKSAGNF